jgi:hypothetical protein
MPRTTESGRYNALRRYRAADDPAVMEARDQLLAQQLETHIRQVVDAAPPLSKAQRDRLAVLLRTGGGGDA